MREQDRIQLMVDNPREAVMHSWSREPAFYDRFLAHVLSIGDADPKAGKGPAKIAILHAPTACQSVQGYGLWAHVHRATGELDVADSAIEAGFFHADGCPSCIADLHRRRAVLRRNQHDFSGAIESASEAIRRYRELGHSGHDLYGNGLASSYNVRAGIRFFMDNFEGAASDYREALAVLDPRVSPTLYRMVIANLAWALQATRQRSNLLEANKYLKKARRLYKGITTGSQERAKLEWLTAQVRYQLDRCGLGEAKPADLRKMMQRSLEFFLSSGMALEAIAVASDLMKMKLAQRYWGKGTARDLIRETLKTLSDRLPKVSVEACAALQKVNLAVDSCQLNAKDSLREAVDELRETCSTGSIACLVTWEPI